MQACKTYLVIQADLQYKENRGKQKYGIEIRGWGKCGNIQVW